MLKHALSTYMETECSDSTSFPSSVPSSPGLCTIDTRPRTPLTAENLKYHAMYITDEDASENLMKRFQASLDREQLVSPTPSTLKRSKRSRSSLSQDTFIESPQHSLFPYHNDSFMLPTASCSSNSIKSPWASSTVVAESTMTLDSSRGRLPVPAVDRPPTPAAALPAISSKSQIKKYTSAKSLPNDAELTLLYVEARPTKLSLTLGKILQWLTPAGTAKIRKGLRRRTAQSWHIRMDE